MKHKFIAIIGIIALLAIANQASAIYYEGEDQNIGNNDEPTLLRATLYTEEGNVNDEAVSSDDEVTIQILGAEEDTEPVNNVNNQTQTEKGQSVKQQRRSQVANAIQNMIRISEKNEGIGEQVRVIAQNQNRIHIDLEKNLEKIQERSRVMNFLVGPNYKAINQAKKIMTENKEQIQQLKEVKQQLQNELDVEELAEQIKQLEQVQIDAENDLKNVKKGFSLFGWLNKLLNRE